MEYKLSHFRRACNRKCISSLEKLEKTVLLNGVSKEFFTMTVHDNIDRNEEALTGKLKLNSSLKKNFCSQKCNLIATRFCYFLYNGIEEIISYRYIWF